MTLSNHRRGKGTFTVPVTITTAVAARMRSKFHYMSCLYGNKVMMSYRGREGPSPYLTVSTDVDEDEDEAKDGTEEGDGHTSSVHLESTTTTHCNNCGQQLSRH